MENIISIIEEITVQCEKCNYFDAATLFVKTNFTNKNITFIAIGSTSDTVETLQINNLQYNIYHVKVARCYSGLLQRDAFFSELFKETLCLKDELNIAPVLLSAVKPITKPIHLTLEANAHFYANYNRNRQKELAVKFNGIENIDDFLTKAYIPISSSLKDNLSKAHVIFQYYYMGKIKSLAIIFLFENTVTEKILIDIQKYLYLHSSELSLRNIDIPFQRPYCIFDGMVENVYNEVMKTLSTLTSASLIQNSRSASQKDKVEDEKVTTLIYLYIATAKIIFNNYSDFMKSNDKVYDYFIKEECSDNFQYIINNHIYTNCFTKIENEFRLLTLTNIQALYSNYRPLLRDWNRLENEYIYQQYISQVYHIKSTLKEDTSIFFQEYVKLLFACYDLPVYYKTYIPYVIKHLSNEI